MSKEYAAIIGIDLAKRVFHIHGADASGKVLYRRKLSRSKMLKFFFDQPCWRHRKVCSLRCVKAERSVNVMA